MADTALEIARTILTGFNRHYQIFRQTSASARKLFENQRWTQLRASNHARIDFYDLRVQETVETLLRRFVADCGAGADAGATPSVTDDELWPQIKQAYIGLLYNHLQPELAETFFNTVAAKVLARHYHSNQYVFSRPAVASEHIEGTQPTYRCYYPAQEGIRSTVGRILEDFQLGVPLADPKRCISNLIQAFRDWLPAPFHPEPNFHVQVLCSLFYRNRAAYSVGRVINGKEVRLFAIPLLHELKDDVSVGLVVDALIHDPEQLANLFSVSHSYFMVEMEVPSSWVSFIHEALPEKPKAELYTAFGLQKQGKTLFIRDLNQHLKHSTDPFVIAPGARGMVMLVFTLTSFPFVFKVIRDRFDPPKDTSREIVRQKYDLVKHHDRVGRMADTLEYANLALPLDRFDPQLLQEMNRLIPSSLVFEESFVVIKHLYIEHRLTPLDLYLRSQDPNRLLHGVREFGQVLKDLAATNLFPGDLLPKNFGMSAHGRLLFYDYDEVCYLTDCNFRELHMAESSEDELRAEPWYNVGPHDIFPEEFDKFLFSDPRARQLFREIHGELLTASFWTHLQENIRLGVEADLFPYPAGIRFNAGHSHRPKARGQRLWSPGTPLEA